MCIFSQFPIEETLFFPYTMTGLGHRLQIGDWFTQPGVGMAKVMLPRGIRVNVYVTHVSGVQVSQHTFNYTVGSLIL